MGKLLRFAFRKSGDPRILEADLALAIFAAECVYGKPRVRMEAAYSVARDGRACVLDVSGESGEAAARIFTGLAAVRLGEGGFRVKRLQKYGDRAPAIPERGPKMAEDADLLSKLLAGFEGVTESDSIVRDTALYSVHQDWKRPNVRVNTHACKWKLHYLEGSTP